jgi:hypothetical protein
MYEFFELVITGFFLALLGGSVPIYLIGALIIILTAE